MHARSPGRWLWLPAAILGFSLAAADLDGDGVADGVDCRPDDASVWAVPSPVTGLSLSGKVVTTLTWTAPVAPGGTALLYDLLRATSAQGFGSAVCVSSSSSATTTQDGAPSSGISYYLVRAKNKCGGDVAGASCSLAWGAACADDAVCEGGFCTDGVCCSSRCGGTCETCASAGHAGSCEPIPAGQDPANECADASCSGAGSLDLADTCSGARSCADGGTVSCGAYACDAGAAQCYTSCTSSAQCTAGRGCEAPTGLCLLNDGQFCVADGECLNDACCSNDCSDLTSDATSCGTCGLTCTNPHGSTLCSGGVCQPSCAFRFGSCDGNAANGCETSLTTLAHCGACDSVCDLFHATESCSTGTCLLTGCEAGASSCDGDTTNGCEVSHASVGGTCTSPTNVGTYDGDTQCGVGCGGNLNWDNFANRMGMTSAWFHARVREQSTCLSARVEHQIRLLVPTGIDFDLYVYRPCGTLVGFSTNGTGVTDVVTVSSVDASGTDDGFDYWVEVRYASGASCNPWSLQFFGHDCP